MTKPNTKAIDLRVDDLVQLSRLIKRFMAIPRATIMDGRYETDGEHTLHLQMLAVAYAAQYHPELDVAKVALYCMVHDFVEVYADDTPTLTANEGELAQKYEREALALAQLDDELSAAWPFFVALIKQYEELAEPEARFVRCFDKCDPGFSHYENSGEALLRLGLTTGQAYHTANERVGKRITAYSEGFEDVLELRDELQYRVAKRTYRAV